MVYISLHNSSGDDIYTAKEGFENHQIIEWLKDSTNIITVDYEFATPYDDDLKLTAFDPSVLYSNVHIFNTKAVDLETLKSLAEAMTGFVYSILDINSVDLKAKEVTFNANSVKLTYSNIGSLIELLRSVTPYGLAKLIKKAQSHKVEDLLIYVV